MDKNNSALFFTCSLIEFIGRTTKNKRQHIVDCLGTEDVTRIYQKFYQSRDYLAACYKEGQILTA